MLDPKPMGVQARSSSPEATLSAGDDVDLNAKFEQEEQRVRGEENHLGGWIGGRR